MMFISPTLLLASLSVLSATQANAIPVRNVDGTIKNAAPCNMDAQPEASDSCATYWSKQPAPVSDFATSPPLTQIKPVNFLEARALTRRFDAIENGIAFGDYTKNAVVTVVQGLVYAYGSAWLHPPIGITSSMNLFYVSNDLWNALNGGEFWANGGFVLGGVKFWYSINTEESKTPMYIVRNLIGTEILACIFADSMEGIAETDNQNVAMQLWQKGALVGRLALGTYS